MGLIGDAFGKLFRFLGSILVAVITFLGDVFGKLFSVIWEGVKWIGNLIKMLFQGLIDFLFIFFTAIFDVIKGLLYLLYMIGVLAVKLFLVIFEAAKILWSLIVGFGRTLGSLKYTPTSGGGHGYSEIIGKLMTNLNVLQIDVIAYVLLFILWFVTAISAIKLISSIRVGGE